jgi:UDP-arabinose 4-epimerase
MTARTVLVTGGAGFIGSHTCKALRANGIVPVAVDNLSRGNERAVRWGPLERADIRDREAMKSIISRYRPEAVIHFAASAYVGESVSSPASYYDNNVAGTLALLEACLESNLLRIIFSSSCATYGIPDKLPITESSPQRPINPYGRTKLVCEQVIADYAEAYHLKYVILRYFNACGADPQGEIGEWHQPETHLIPRALMAAAGLLEQLEIFGNDYDTADGTCVRDYIHVTDLARGHCAALAHLSRAGGNIAVNLGTGKGASINEVLEAIARNTGRIVPVKFLPRRPGDPPALVADPSLARSLLGFSARYSDLDSIIKTASPFFGHLERAA